MKTQFLDRRVGVNASGFYYDYTDIQLQRLNNGALGIINGARAHQGARRRHGRRRHVGAAAYRQRRVPRFELRQLLAAPVSTTAGGTPVMIGDVTGNQLPVAFKFSGTVGANYAVELNGARRSAQRYRLLQFGLVQQTRQCDPPEEVRRGQRHVRWTAPHDRFYVAVWGNNLTNAKFRANATTLAFGNHVVSFNPPRTYGVTGDFSF